ncbi:hypothetical protein ASF17_00760 [Frigoribacterium sp. Leaf263]|uniref:hypothetical protein n=1 Tax=Frigoribacterium sp. Leaf263 TaxID=1736313 RepID=UPI0006F2B8DD|nr:hypothetical protein [Frigoribacterium sp. Leaf263]KQO84118.1 hypothetical protein ASF17_00760 [Frigoribacterium sp. Leaf263]
MTATPPAAGRSVRATRALLVVFGIALIGLGGYVLTETVSPTRYGGLLVWLLGSVIVHDAIIAPLVVVAALAVRRTGRRIPGVVVALVQSAVVVGVVMTMIVVPEIVAQAKGPKNDTVLPFDYAGRLSVMWLVIVVLTALAVVVYLVRTRRQKSRESTDQV